jgi:hypothetical protein
MPLAAPLILPFAELAGITIAGLGMAAASKKVSDFISDNPEISTQILTTLVPGGVGLNALFKDKDAPSTKDIVLGELGKEKGNYSSPDAEGAYSSKRGRIIKALEEAGKIKKGPDKDYDSSKKYKGYKKFYEKADGGAIGTPYDAIATTQDFTNALDKVGAGTDLQKAVAIGEYGQNARRQNPFKNLGFLDTQRHFDNNQLLKNAVTRGELSSADYNRLGGFDVAQTMGAGNPVLGGIGNLIGSTGYNIVQSLKGNQSPFDIPGDVFRNVQGGTGLISDDLKTQYESIINSSTPTPNASTDRPTMADVAGPGTSNNLLSLFERYKDIQTPAGADPNNPDFVGETALGNIERGISDFLKSDRGLKYGKDIPSDINDIYSFIEAQRRSFSPDLSQNYQGGNLYNYLQDFYQYKYGNPRIELPSGNYGYYDEQGPDGPVSNERENIFKSYFNQPYKYGLKDGGAIGIEVLFEEKKDGGRIGYQSGGGLMDIETEFGLQAPKGTISFDDYLGSFDDYLGGLYNSDKVGALQNLAVKDYAQGDYTKTATGPISDFRHQAAMNELSKSFSPGLVPNIIGDTIAFGAGLINEIPALGRGVNRENLREIGEDIVSNFKGTYGTSNKRTPEEIYDSIFNPRTTVVSSPNLTYGTAAAADFQDGQILQPNVVPERIAPATYYNSAPNFNADVLREEEDAQYNLPQKNMLQNLKDYLPFIGDKSITGMLTRGIGQFFNNIGDRIPSTPQYQRYTPGYNYGNLNPNLIDDFYDPATGLNRFDRAKTLFGQSRTLSEFLSKRRERAAAEADLVQRREIERKLEREKALARNTSSNIDYGGFVSGGGTHSSDSSFTGHSSATGGGMGQSGWGGPRADGGFIGQYFNGGLATMFRRKQ